MTRTFAILGWHCMPLPCLDERRSIGTEVGPSRWFLDGIGEEAAMLKFLGTTMGIIFLIGLLVVIGLFALIF